jgi:thioredoxin-like negative regulator of GroEL
MDMHLERLAPAHLECKFIKINADKAPFFVQKLQIRVLPAVLVFIDGISVSRIEGFEGLNDDMSPGKEDEWPTGNLARRLALEKAINFTAQDVMNKQRIAAASIFARAGLQEDDLSDFDD